VRHLLFAVIAIFVSAACGGGESTGSESGSGTNSQTSGGEGGGGSGDEAREGEFQISESLTAGDAHGERPSEIEATETEAAMRLFVVSPDTGPIPGIVIKMTAPDGTEYYTQETDSHGYGEVLVPVGQRYEMEYLALGRRNTTATVEVPEGPNQDIRLTMRYRRWRPPPEDPEEEPEGIVLDGILFESGSATIQEESFPRLDRVVEYMQHKPSSRIRIEGHTDNVGNARRNQRLSQARAQAVAAYLTSHGIDEDRVEAVGKGDTEPVASNDTDEGRAQNRRIEAVEL
jgi:outer membrane protein OmpA-like peptidoglycan-associated protein